MTSFITKRDVMEELIDRLLSLTGAEQEAYRNAQLFLTTLGYLEHSCRCYASMSREEMHKLFVHFAIKMDWFGDAYLLQEDGRCKAITIFLGDEDEDLGSSKRFWFCPPPSVFYRRAPWRLDDHPQKDRLIHSAKEIHPILVAMRTRSQR